MKREEIYAAFAAMDQTHPFYVAVCAMVDEEVTDETAGAVAPDLSDSKRQFNAGRLAHAVDFGRAFRGVMRDAVSWQRKVEQTTAAAQTR
jgi:hypothetical protein